MSSIAGMVRYEGGLASEIETLEKMSETMAHRGPDSKGTWVTETVAFAHRRLATLDAESGVQPFKRTVQGRTCAVMLDGNIDRAMNKAN